MEQDNHTDKGYDHKNSHREASESQRHDVRIRRFVTGVTIALIVFSHDSYHYRRGL